MRDTDYAFCVARLRAAENKMLRREDFDSLIGAKNYFEAVKYLVQKGYAEKNSGLTQIIAFQNERLWDMLTGSVPDKAVLDRLCVLNDFFNIKAAVKCFFTDDDAEDYFLRPTTVDLKKLSKAFSDRDFTFLGEDKAKAARQAYETALKSGNGQHAAIIIDSAAVACLKEYAENKKSGISGEICALLCDTANIKIALRCRKAGKGRDFVESALGECVSLDRGKLAQFCQRQDSSLIDYLKTTKYASGVRAYEKSSGDFDRWCDEETLKICSDAKFKAFGFDPVCAYYYSRLSEIKKVRIILSCKLSGVSEGSIRERLGV